VSGADLRLHAERFGADPVEGGDTFLLVHGYGASTFSWRYWTPRLADLGHVVEVDLKGHGESPRPDDGRYAPADQAALVRGLIDEHDLRDLTLVGHSLGGGVALLVALGLLSETPSRLKRLVIVAGAAYPQPLPPFVTMAGWPRLTSSFFDVIGPRRIVATTLRLIVHDRSSVTPEQVAGYAAPLSTPGALQVLLASARQIVPPDLPDLVERYPEIDVPTLLIWGREDPVVPLWVGERLQRELPHARLHVFERCGHLPAEEHAVESLEVLEDFLRTT